MKCPIRCFRAGRVQLLPYFGDLYVSGGQLWSDPLTQSEQCSTTTDGLDIRATALICQAGQLLHRDVESERPSACMDGENGSPFDFIGILKFNHEIETSWPQHSRVSQ